MIAASGGYGHSVATGREGGATFWAWGLATEGQLGDGYKSDRYLPALIYLGYADADLDGLPDWLEKEFGTNASVADSNGDGIDDRTNHYAGQDPLELDNDGDGILNSAELLAGTNPFLTDTDGDGVIDGVDDFPLDPTRNDAPSPDINDHTAPAINLTKLHHANKRQRANQEAFFKL